MFASEPRDRSAAVTPAPPLWLSVLEQVQAKIASGRARAARLEGAATVAAAGAAARAHSRLLIALEAQPRIEQQLVSELVDDAVQLLVAVAELRAGAGQSGERERLALIDQLHGCLNAHEEGVLAGELTYSVRLEEGEPPAVRIRHALVNAPAGGAIPQSELISLRIAAVNLAALLVRAAANVTVAGSAHQAPDPRSPALDESLRAITDELARCARAVERPAHAGGDIIAHHLAGGMRVSPAFEAMNESAGAATWGRTDSGAVAAARAAWLRLATCEYVAVTALGNQLEAPTHDRRLGTTADAIQASAANIVYGARLVERAEAFHHRRAWRHQMIGLSYALEAYIAGIRGDTPSLAQAQLIALTRLARAVAAISTLDLRRR